MYYARQTVFEEDLMHYGVPGMHWGVQNGPPYPLDRKIANQMRHTNTTTDINKLKMSTKQVMLGKTPATLYEWKNGNNKVAEFKTWDWWDGINVSDLEINEKYRGNKLSYQLLDYATKKCGVKNLAVKKNNHIAKHVYDKYGFKTTEEDNEYYYMSIKK